MGLFSGNYNEGDRVQDVRSGATGTVHSGEVRWNGSFLADELAVAEANGLQPAPEDTDA